MASVTFDRFLKQLYAQGREKADGFDPGDFDGMAANERQEAARLLREALLKGDDTAARGLVFLDPQTARPILEEALQKVQGDAWVRLSAARELWGLTGESHYQGLMIDALRDPSELIRHRTLVALEETPHNDRLMTALESLVKDDPDNVTRFMAAKHLLFGLGLITDIHDTNHPYKQKVRDLTDENRQVREKALAELKSRQDTN